MTGGVPITRDLVAAMLAEEAEQALENIDPESAGRIRRPETSSSTAVWVRSSLFRDQLRLQPPPLGPPRT